MKLTNTKQQQLKIDLNVIHNPSPQLIKTFEDANAIDLFVDKDMRSEYVNEKRIMNAANSSKKPIKHKITVCVRKKVGKTEYCYFLNHMLALDYFGNKLDWTRKIGTYERPVFTENRALTMAAPKSDGTMEPQRTNIEVESVEEVFDYPWEQIQQQLREWKESGVIDDNSKFYVVTADGKKYAKPFTYEEFTELSLEDLVVLGEHDRKYDGLLRSMGPTTEMISIIRQKIKEELMITKPTPTPTPT